MRKFILCLVVAGLLFGCGKVVPPGNTVMVLSADGKADIKHEGVYRAWGRDRIYFVDTKLKSYNKDMKVLCKDDIKMDAAIKWLGSFKVTDKTIDMIKKKVPATKVTEGEIKGMKLSLDKFFETAMRDQLSNIAREEISVYITDNIREERQAIQEKIKARFLKTMDDLNYPIETADVILTRLDYPEMIKTKMENIKKEELQDEENAAIAKANVAKAKRDAELAAEKGKAQLVAAKADAAANKARAASLTPAILAVKQLETLVRLAESENNTAIVVPFEAIRPGGMQDMLINRDAIDKLAKSMK